jgi:hypothetical protein
MRTLLALITAASMLPAFTACSDDDNDKDTGPGMEAGTKPETGPGTEAGADMPAGGNTCMTWCDTAADCPAPTFKDCVNNKCVMCKDNSDCDSNHKGGCNTATGICKRCSADADCDIAGTPFMTGKCDTATGNCLKCATDTDCNYAASTFRFCLNNLCVACKVDADCAGGLSRCDAATGTCGCADDDECCTSAGGTAGCGLTCNAGACNCPDDKTCSDLFIATGMKYKCGSM